MEKVICICDICGTDKVRIPMRLIFPIVTHEKVFDVTAIISLKYLNRTESEESHFCERCLRNIFDEFRDQFYGRQTTPSAEAVRISSEGQEDNDRQD